MIDDDLSGQGGAVDTEEVVVQVVEGIMEGDPANQEVMVFARVVGCDAPWLAVPKKDIDNGVITMEKFYDMVLQDYLNRKHGMFLMDPEGRIVGGTEN